MSEGPRRDARGKTGSVDAGHTPHVSGASQVWFARRTVAHFTVI
ncbi:hypothetical protein [Paraburkholderia sp. J63]|nr:hypothetical protein [Paraburkholderia sp. J63]